MRTSKQLHTETEELTSQLSNSRSGATTMPRINLLSGDKHVPAVGTPEHYLLCGQLAALMGGGDGLERGWHPRHLTSAS